MIIQPVERKSILQNPTLQCLRSAVSINVAAGCQHRCLYCYARGYTSYPGLNRLKLYTNVPQLLRRELPRKRRMPPRAILCCSTDPFQNLTQVQALTLEALECLFETGIAVTIFTKGVIGQDAMRLLAHNADLVDVQMGLICADQAVLSHLEPEAAAAQTRLAQMAELIRAGVQVAVRFTPIIPGITDTTGRLEQTFEALRKSGVDHVVLSYLFLRSHIRRLFADNGLQCVLDRYHRGHRQPLAGSGKEIELLPAPQRQEGYDRIGWLGRRLGISCHVCRCENYDLPSENCQLGFATPQAAGPLFAACR